MRSFVLLLDPEGNGIPTALVRAYEALPRSRGLEFRWQSFSHAAALTAWDEDHEDPLIVIDGNHVVVGMVRLDNRSELYNGATNGADKFGHLDVVLHAVAEHGARFVPRLLGDFAFVAWDATTRTAVAACDAFRVKQLYYAARNGLFAFASRAEALALDNQYEVQYLAERVATCSPAPDLTAYAGVHPVPAGCMVLLERARLTVRRYWSASAFEPERSWVKSERDAADACQKLLAESVRLRLTGGTDTWAQLSGGIDSSSVVSLAQRLAERGSIPNGLAGTVTYVDRQGTAADERRYSDAIVSRWGVRNQAIVDPPIWYDEQFAPPRLDQPHLHLALYPRECRACAAVRGAGGRVLLTGLGGDELFAGIMLFFADWIIEGRVWAAMREMARRAAIGRVSFWELAYRNALVPLLPRGAQRRLISDQGQVPQWMLRSTARRYGLDARAFVASEYAGRLGHKYHHAIVTNVDAVGRAPLGSGFAADALDIRHPFLYRPLVEFALRLPSELCSRPHARKWLLREAMRGIVPEIVRTRVGKGTPAQLFAWSLSAQRSLLEPLLRDPILADLRVIDPVCLRAAVDRARDQPHRRQEVHELIQSTLVVEAWLQIRSGRWPGRGLSQQFSGAVVRH